MFYFRGWHSDQFSWFFSFMSESRKENLDRSRSERFGKIFVTISIQNDEILNFMDKIKAIDIRQDKIDKSII